MHSLAIRLFKVFLVLAITLPAANQPGQTQLDRQPLSPLGTINVTAISAGEYHTCVLTSGGGVICWGHNASGQLGSGDKVDRPAQNYVVGLSSGVISVSAGGRHTCALTTARAVWCWGENSSGQLGDGTTTNWLTPVGVSGLSSGVAAISTGGEHTCALTTGGTVKCWGKNSSGQLGINSTTDALTPVSVSGLPSIASVTAGGDHTCALTALGAVWCWGDNTSGQVGDGTIDNRFVPINVSSVSGLPGIASISAGGNHTCARTTSGATWCWGSNFYGQVGNNSTSDQLTPVRVSGLSSGVTLISAGWGHTCARVSPSGAKCWGRNRDGELGDGSSNNDRLIPVNVVGLTSGVASISAGGYHTCALLTSSTVKGWGANLYMQLSNGTTISSSIPTSVIWLLSRSYLPIIRR